MQHDFSNHLFSCSSLGYIMTDPKGKSYKQRYEDALRFRREKGEDYDQMNKETKTAAKLLVQLNKNQETIAKVKDKIHIPNLSDTCKTHLCDIYTVVTTGRTSDIKTKYFEKGILMEEDNITLYSLFTNTYHKKNIVRINNDYLTGEMDIEDEEKIIDIKTNWNVFTFNRVIARPIKPHYHWQLDGYMWLWDKQKGRLAYCLSNTPEKLIKMEEKRLLYDFIGTDEDYVAACQELKFLHTYDDLPIERRVRVFDVDRDDNRIERVKSRIDECREFLNNIENVPVGLEEEEEESVAA